MNIPILSFITESTQFQVRKTNKRLTDRSLLGTQRPNLTEKYQKETSPEDMNISEFMEQYRKNPFFRTKMKHILKSNQKIVNSKGFQNYKSSIINGSKTKILKKNSNNDRVKLLTGRQAYTEQLHSLYQLLLKIIESDEIKENEKKLEQNSDESKENLSVGQKNKKQHKNYKN